MTGWLDHSGMGLHWREDGDPHGRPVLFLNSLGTDLRLWDAVAARVSGIRIIRMDTRGHGLSAAPDAPYSLATLTDDAARLIDHLELTRLTVIGVSLGGMMAQALAAARPDRIERLVLSNTAIRMGTAEIWSQRIADIQAAGIESIAEAILDRWFAPAFRNSSEVGLWRNMLIRTPAEGYIGCCSALAAADLSSVAPRIACRALVIGGTEDGASPPDIVRALAEAIPGAAYSEMADVGHLPMVEAPDRFATLVNEFIREAPDV